MTPAKDRTRKHLTELKARGGRRVTANLEPLAVSALDYLIERSNPATATQAITDALRAQAPAWSPMKREQQINRLRRR